VLSFASALAEQDGGWELRLMPVSRPMGTMLSDLSRTVKRLYGATTEWYAPWLGMPTVGHWSLPIEAGRHPSFDFAPLRLS